MYILKNAWISILRNKGRNILIGIIIIAIACTSTVSLAIKTSANSLISSYENKYEITASIGMNRQNFMKDFDPSDNSSKEDMKEKYSNIESITVDDINEYGNSSYIKSYYYTNSVEMNSSSLEKATSTTSNNKNMGPGNRRMEMPSSGDFSLVGYSSYDAMQEFINGSYTITSGEVNSDFTSLNCIINSELATLNEIKVGDTITLVNPDNSKLTYKLTVSGIFEDKEETTDNRMNMFTNSVNTIITNTTVIEKIVKSDNDIRQNVTPTFILNSKNDIEKFEAELTKKGMNEYFSLSTNLDEIESATDSISNVSSFATTFLIITLIIGATVLFVINMINVRERKYEIGVLRTIGLKKSLLTLQFVIELLIVSIASLMIGAGIGSLISVPTANTLLKNEITSSKEQEKNINNNFGRDMMGENRVNRTKINGVVKVEEVNSINAVVNIKVLFELLGIGVLLTIISSLASMISIQRFSPLDILKERS